MQRQGIPVRIYRALQQVRLGQGEDLILDQGEGL